MNITLTKEENNLSGIYRITNNKDGRLYIGSATKLKHRYSVHKTHLEQAKHHSKKLQNFSNKYGIESLTFELIELCAVSDLIEREQYYLDFYKSYTSLGFNHCPKAASCLGRKHTEESKAIMREKAKGRVVTEETKLKISKANKGNTHTEETKLKIGEAGLGRVVSEETRNKIGLGNSISLKGKILSEETKRLMSDTRKGKKMSDETKLKMSLMLAGNTRNKGRVHTEEARNNMLKACEKKKGVPRSDETKKKISEALKKRNQVN